MPASPDTIFDVANTLALCGWLALLISPWLPRVADAVAALAIPLLLSLAYAVLIGLTIGGSGFSFSDFGSLDGVMKLFSVREGVLIGWLHYLAFDLFIGAWEVRTARREGIAFLAVVPCLALTFLMGPLGLIAFFAVRALAARRVLIAA
ncbi:MAG: ABA4-like family protein [Pseudomonadota bacterium]